MFPPVEKWRRWFRGLSERKDVIQLSIEVEKEDSEENEAVAYEYGVNEIKYMKRLLT